MTTDEKDTETPRTPQTRPEYMAAACDLAEQGLTARDIAEALRLTPNAVRDLLRGRE